MDNHARDAFDGFSAMYNIRGASLRKGANADKSAEEGISPWKIGMLAACLLLATGRCLAAVGRGETSRLCRVRDGRAIDLCVTSVGRQRQRVR